MLAMVSYSRRPQSGQITCYLNRTYHVLLTRPDPPFDRTLPGYLTTPTSENRVGKWRARASDSRICEKEVTG